MAGIWIEAAVLIWVHTTLWYAAALILKRNDIADIAWGLGFIWICLLCISHKATAPFQLILYGQVIMWGLRLSLHIGRRALLKKEEDFRYKAWRQQWGRYFVWRSYLQVFLLQGIFQYIIATPLLAASTGLDQIFSILLIEPHYRHLAPPMLVRILWITGLLLWCAGFILQTLADAQLQRFSKVKKPGEILRSGLWRYSRHPNYFGEILMWWGIGLQVIWIPYAWLTLLSPLTVTWLLSQVSGVPMLEKKYMGNADFERYKKRTSALIPWFVKKENIS